MRMFVLVTLNSGNGQKKFRQRCSMPVEDMDDAKKLAASITGSFFNRTADVCFQIGLAGVTVTVPADDLNYLIDELNRVHDEYYSVAPSPVKKTFGSMKAEIPAKKMPYNPSVSQDKPRIDDAF